MRFALLCVTALMVGGQAGALEVHASNANRYDRPLAQTFEAREKDWRNGAIVYQVLPDRFAPSSRLEEKKSLYPAPKVLRRWDELPTRGTYLESARVWSHEIDFWGGDLQSLAGKLDYVQQLGADVVYLNPVHLAYTNHKYDALDYAQISPEFGTRADVKNLATDVHKRGMKLVLDGVFNHMGRNSPKFVDALRSAKSPYRDWFFIGPQYPGGARSWWLAENLPELNLENSKVRDHVYAAPDSVVRSYLRDGIDGWRLDVAVDIGFNYLDGLTRAAHAQKPGSLVVGEIANYPKEWYPAVDGVMNFTLREIILRVASGAIEPALAMAMVTRMVNESGTEPMLKSWLMLDNHDTQRIATALPQVQQRQLAQVLQFTLPGAPNLYYGSELGMTGGDDPEMRAPMRWDWVNADNKSLAWTRQLIQLRKCHRALRVGNYRPVTSHKLLAFERYTDRAQDTVVVVANTTAAEVTETIMVANSKLMNTFAMVDRLGSGVSLKMQTSLLQVTLPAGGYVVLTPELSPGGGYSAYKRVQ